MFASLRAGHAPPQSQTIPHSHHTKKRKEERKNLSLIKVRSFCSPPPLHSSSFFLLLLLLRGHWLLPHPPSIPSRSHGHGGDPLPLPAAPSRVGPRAAAAAPSSSPPRGRPPPRCSPREPRPAGGGVELRRGARPPRRPPRRRRRPVLRARGPDREFSSGRGGPAESARGRPELHRQGPGVAQEARGRRGPARVVARLRS